VSGRVRAPEIFEAVKFRTLLKSERHLIKTGQRFTDELMRTKKYEFRNVKVA
jgi:hypothetical protein